jgi:hypothetical protein
VETQACLLYPGLLPYLRRSDRPSACIIVLKSDKATAFDQVEEGKKNLPFITFLTKAETITVMDLAEVY